VDKYLGRFFQGLIGATGQSTRGERKHGTGV
jgi:hypothetical protein